MTQSATDPGDPSGATYMLRESALIRTAGKSGLALKPVGGWYFLASLFLALVLTTWLTGFGSLFRLTDLGAWVHAILLLTWPAVLYLLLMLLSTFHRSLDKGKWLWLGNLGHFPLSIETPKGTHTQTLDAAELMRSRGVFVANGQYLYRVKRLLWQPNGAHGWPGLDGGKEGGHAATVESMEYSDDGGKTWTLIYYHPLIQLGDGFVFFQHFVSRAPHEAPSGMVDELVDAYQDDVTTGEIAVAEGFYHFGSLIAKMRARTELREVAVGPVLEKREVVVLEIASQGVNDARQVLDGVFYPTGVIPDPPALIELANLRKSYWREQRTSEDLRAKLSTKVEYDRHQGGSP